MRAVLRLRVFAVRLVDRGLQYLINERLEELWLAAGLLRLAVLRSIYPKQTGVVIFLLSP